MPHNASKRDFFISYTGADRSWADWIAWELREAGYSTVHQAWDFRPGSNFVSEMKAALEQCDRTVAIYSPNYFSSVYCEDEWTAAVAQDSLLPVRVRHCEIPKLLKTRVYIDLVDLTAQAAHHALIDGLSQMGITPRKQPPFPANVSNPKRFPGVLPEIWQVPYLRNPNFTGRDQILLDLHAALQSGRPAALTQAIAGLGGIGMTQLALEYCYLYASEYSVVWWLRAEEPTTLASDYARLAARLDLPKKICPANRISWRPFASGLTHNYGWLLIFDNITAPEQCTAYRPRSCTGHMLITSRSQNWRGSAEPMPIQPLSREESLAFLRRRIGREEPAAAELLSDTVGDLPLALEHAGAYIDSTGVSIREYVGLLSSYSKELLQPVIGTWSISFDRVRDESPAALDLLHLIAYLAPENIPRDLLKSAVESPLAFNKSIESLRRYSLIETAEATISVHRLVQEITRNGLDEREQRRWAEAAVNLVERAFPSDINDRQNWPACSKLLAHAQDSTKHAEDLRVGLGVASRLLNHVALYEMERGQLKSASRLFRRALEIARTLYDPDDPMIGLLASNLGQILQAQGDLDGALYHTRLALEINEKAYGPDHPEVAVIASNLGAILRDLGDFDAALQYTERALKIDEKTYGPYHPFVAIRANNLGQILQGHGDIERALEYSRRALEIDEKVYGANHPEIATDLSNLGTILEMQRDLEGASRHYQGALKILEAAYGPDSPRTKALVSNLRILEVKMASRKSVAVLM